MNDRLRLLQRHPRRVSITLSQHVYDRLLNRSEEEGRSISNLCAFLIEEALHDEQRGMVPPLPSQAIWPGGRTMAAGQG
jgi:hypothetical protein